MILIRVVIKILRFNFYKIIIWLYFIDIIYHILAILVINIIIITI